MVPIPDEVRDLFERPVLCMLASLMPDGQPQVNPVWCDYDGEFVRINTARGRQKDRNMTKRAKVTALLVDPNNNNRWVEVRGHIADVTEEGGNEHINQLSHKYNNGADYKGLKPGMVRVIYKIEPDRVNVYKP